MNLSVGFMSSVLGGIGVIAYLAAPFLEENKKAFYARLLSQAFFGLMFFYIGCLAGVSYYAFLLLSGLFQKQIEHNKIVSIVYGMIAMAVTFFVNNTGYSGIVLAVSLFLIFLPINEDTMLTTTSYIDVLTSLALAYYSLNVKAWVSLVFAIILLLIAVAGLVSNIKLSRAGGLKAVEREEMEYQRQKAQNKKNRKIGR